MFQQLLWVHWRGVRFGLVPFVLAAFGLPLLAVQGTMPAPGESWDAPVQAARLLGHIMVWVPLFPLLATLAGVTLALSAWNWDHRGDHVYALTLPVSRPAYVGMKMGAGALLLLIPVIAFWIGSLTATSMLRIPEGLQAYPSAVTVRFLLTCLLIYSLLFALAAGTLRTAIWVLGGFVALVVLGGILPGFLARTFFPGLAGWSFLDWLLNASLSWPGPFEILTGSWMLVDV
jgi:hypothetical protein